MTQIANVELPPIYDASRADNAILDMVKKRIRAGIMPPRWHIPYLDNTAHPLYPTWSYLVCGRSGSMKSTLMSHLVRKWSQMLHEENKDRALKRVIVYVKPEENIEMARYQTWDTQPFSLQELVGGKPGAKAVSEAIAKQSTPPVLFIGDSESDEYVPKVKRRRPVRFSTQDITNACDAIMDGLFFEQCEIAMLVIDGLYLIDDEARSQNRVDRMANVTPEMNVLAKRFKTPLIATTQAIQKGVYNKADSIPHMDDVMWNTTASQDFYAFIGIERPVKRPGVEMARYTLNGWEGDFETYFDEDNHKYKVPITIPLISMLVDKYRGTRNCESRKVALWAEDDGGITQKLLPNYKV